MRSSLALLALCAACGGHGASSQADPGQPPPRPGPDGLSPATATTTTWAIDAISLGEAPRSGPATSDAWRSFGFDLDRLATTKDSTDVCALTSGAPLTNQSDGDFGIDNAWGATIVPLVQTALSLPTPSLTVSDALGKGATTLELEVTGLPADASASAVGLRLRAFVAASVQTAPFGADVSRAVAASSVVDGATLASGARTTFSDAYVVGGTFVSGSSSAPLVLRLPFQAPLELQIHDAIVTFARSGGDDAIVGTIAGVLDVEAFIASAAALGAVVYPPFCSTPAEFDGVAGQIREARDILEDGTNRSGVPCDGISIGLGFHAKRVADPTDVVADPPVTPCE